jgi:hypothetical protein
MNSKEKKIFFLYIIYSLVFLICTTNYLSIDDLTYKASQTDIINYLKISKFAPYLAVNSDIAQHDAQRFLVPYIVGLVSFITSFEIFFIYKILSLLMIIVIMTINYYFSIKLNFDLKTSIIFFSLFFFNPYTIRYNIFNPVMAHDLLFYICCYFFSLGLILRRNSLFVIASYLTIFLRQTSIALVIGSIIFMIIKKNSFKNIFYYISFFIIFFCITLYVGKMSSYREFPMRNAYAILNYDFNELFRLIKFLALPLMSFLPLSLVIFGKIKNNIDFKTVITLLFVCMMMVGQPILGGPDASSRNVVRIATLCYPIILMAIFYIYDFKYFFNKKIIFFLLLIFFHIWSLHPTFSSTNIFSFLRF